MPNSISMIETTLTAIAGCRASQATTPGSGGQADQ
jgi:hypothetical protein